MEKALNDLLKQLAVLLEINGSQKEKLLDFLNNPVFGKANSLRSILERGKMNMAIRIAPARTTLSDKTLQYPILRTLMT